MRRTVGVGLTLVAAVGIVVSGSIFRSSVELHDAVAVAISKRQNRSMSRRRLRPERRTHTSLNIELDRTISIPLDLDEIAGDFGAVFEVAGFGDVVPEGLHVPGGGGAAFGLSRLSRYFIDLSIDREGCGLDRIDFCFAKIDFAALLAYHRRNTI